MNFHYDEALGGKRPAKVRRHLLARVMNRARRPGETQLGNCLDNVRFFFPSRGDSGPMAGAERP